jgi:hypothetical protein
VQQPCKKHYFHMECILPCFKNGDWRCPLCRSL